jgi:hypothetical protein
MKVYKTILLVILALAFWGCGMFQPAESPTGTLKNYVEATQKKDVAAIKQTLSGGTLKMIEESAQRRGTTLDEVLTKDAGGTTYKQAPETRNEKIEGDAATLEVKNAATADWDRIPFVREEGKWKIALDKFLQER